ncbi:MAG: GNAT family N-acetyltransferase, partial [Rickettsia sp.]|nr:GNAT family N-acetyltransferase [Rickettsia sp.]
NLSHKDTIFNWLKEPHVQEFWDNSQEHKDDILNFINGRIKPSSYADGLYTYWIGCIYNEPYCLVMTLQEKQEYSIPLLKKAYLSKHGHTYSMDYTIGNIAYFGKGLGAKTLEVVMIAKLILFLSIQMSQIQGLDMFMKRWDLNISMILLWKERGYLLDAKHIF